MIVVKFGGTSVSTKERIKTIAQVVKKELKRQPVIVVSAMSGVTDLLLSSVSGKTEIIDKIRFIHRNLIEDLFVEKADREFFFSYIDRNLIEIQNIIRKKDLDKASLDKLVSYGEIMSSYIIAQALNGMGIKAAQVISTVLIVTDNNFGSAEFLAQETKISTRKILLPLFKKGITPIITGFIGRTISGNTTTLGRGGSDYSASIIGFALDAKEIQIWTDVDGILTADPRLVKNAKLIKTISYREASELATFGAKVLHPRSIRPAIKNGIPVRILNSFNIENKGTLIIDKTNNNNPITAISSKKKITAVNIYSTDMFLQRGFLARVFQAFANENISIDLISVSEVSISLTLDNDEHLDNVVLELSKFSTVTFTKDLGIVSLVGEKIVASSLIIKTIFNILDKEKILVKMVSLGATDINLSLVLEQNQVEHAVRVLHDRLLIKHFKSGGNNRSKLIGKKESSVTKFVSVGVN